MRHTILHAPVSPSAPNHTVLPVIIYHDIKEDPVELFKRNDWHQVWINGVFDYHHFHPNCHEVLGVKEGQAELMIGGENGQTVTVQKGDVLLLPAGYGHKRLNKSEDFKIVGAYPNEEEVKTETSYDNLTAINRSINSVKLPNSDPVTGSNGPMFKEWHNIYYCNAEY